MSSSDSDNFHLGARIRAAEQRPADAPLPAAMRDGPVLVPVRASVVICRANRPVVQIPARSARQAVVIAHHLLTEESAREGIELVEVRSATGSVVAQWQPDHHVWRQVPLSEPPGTPRPGGGGGAR